MSQYNLAFQHVDNRLLLAHRWILQPSDIKHNGLFPYLNIGVNNRLINCSTMCNLNLRVNIVKIKKYCNLIMVLHITNLYIIMNETTGYVLII